MASASVRSALFLQFIMATLSLAACTKFRPLASIASSAFHCPPLPFASRRLISSRNNGKSKSSAAYGRTTFRHLLRDTESWRMTLSSDESYLTSESSSASTSTSSTSPSNVEQYRNPNNLDDQVFAAISADGGLKVTVATIRNLLNEMMIQHSMNPLPGGKCMLLIHS
jgi:hypothetical protein